MSKAEKSKGLPTNGYVNSLRHNLREHLLWLMRPKKIVTVDKMKMTWRTVIDLTGSTECILIQECPMLCIDLS